MSTTPGTSDTDGFHVVVADDGSVPAAELARLGVRPGMHLRLVSAGAGQSGDRRTARGILAGTVPVEAIEAWDRALDEDRAERRAALGAIAE